MAQICGTDSVNEVGKMLIISPTSSDEIIHFLTQVVFIELAFP